MVAIDIEMPTDCSSCWIRRNMGCKIANESGWLNNRRDDQCPLKEQELPTELKQKMWNALYAEEDECEKKFVGKEEHFNWFTVYRPWLQKGFDIAINAIADWEGR